MDKVAIITGASSGIGHATAKQLAGLGMRVVLAARDRAALDTLGSQIEGQGGVAHVVPTDVTHRDQVEQLVASTLDRFGHIDVLVNNAGIMPLSFMRNTRVDEWDQMIAVNINGALYCIAAVLGHMRERNTGHIVNVSSVAGRRIFPSAAVYCGTKFALNAISEGLRNELIAEGKNIRVTLVEPGATATKLGEGIADPDVHAHFAGMGSQVRFLDADDIARAVVFAVTQPDHVSVTELLVMPHNEPLP